MSSPTATGTAVQQRNKNALGFLEGQLKQMLPRIAELLPRRAGDPHKFVRMVMMACVRNPNLLNMDRSSLLTAVMNAAELGLSCSGGPASRAHLVPFKGKVTCIPDYKGLIDIALDSGKIDHVEAEVVCANDEFTYRRGTEPLLSHTPKLTDRGEPIAFYAVAWPHGASRPVWIVMSRAEVEAIRDDSPGYQYAAKSGGDSPWTKRFVEMGKKTAIRRLYKWLPTTAEMQRAEEIDTAAEAGDMATIEAIAEAAVTEADKAERGAYLKTLAEVKLREPERMARLLVDSGFDANVNPETLSLDALRAIDAELIAPAEKLPAAAAEKTDGGALSEQPAAKRSK